MKNVQKTSGLNPIAAFLMNYTRTKLPVVTDKFMTAKKKMPPALPATSLSFVYLIYTIPKKKCQVGLAKNLSQFCHFQNQFFCFFPAEARVGD